MNCLDLKSSVLDGDLCCGCGACVGVCPAGALAIDVARSHEPVIDESKCTDCGLCFDVCPGKGYAVAALKCDEGVRLLPERGPVVKCLAGHSTDPDIRTSSSSGGIATSLLTHQLESGQVDSVLVIGWKDEKPVIRLTSDIREIADSAGSKYGPVPMLAELIPALMERPRRIAAAFTPCQLAGLRLAIKRIPRLLESDITSIGLFCGYVQSYDALGAVASTLGLDYPGEARLTHWRYGPYPGGPRFERPDGSAVEKPLYQYYDMAIPHYSLRRCFLCPESGNWQSDLTLGDIHSGGDRETVIVCRTKKGSSVLESARQAGRISTREMTADQIGQSTIRHIARSKMLPAIASIAWLRKKQCPVPEFDYDEVALLRNRKKMIRTLWVWKYRLTFWCRTGWRRRFLLKRPSLMEKTGHFLYTFPNSIPGWKLLAGGRSLFRR